MSLAKYKNVTGYGKTLRMGNFVKIKFAINFISTTLELQWSPSNPDIVGTKYLWPDYRGVLFSGVIDTMWVWLNAISNDVM